MSLTKKSNMGPALKVAIRKYPTRVQEPGVIDTSAYGMLMQSALVDAPRLNDELPSE